MAWDAIDRTAPTVDRTGAETPAFRPAGLPEFVPSAAHLPPPVLARPRKETDRLRRLRNS
eukprot:4811698-Prymnesium_polylepis.1